jgi:hypothetical protein
LENADGAMGLCASSGQVSGAGGCDPLQGGREREREREPPFGTGQGARRFVAR